MQTDIFKFTGVPKEGSWVQTPIESSKNVLRVCKTYSPSPAFVFIKSKILYRKTLEIVR